MYRKESGKPRAADAPGPQASGTKTTANSGVFTPVRDGGAITRGETMYEHALKNTQSHRLQKALGKR
jgi:hypothetical protein